MAVTANRPKAVKASIMDNRIQPVASRHRSVMLAGFDTPVGWRGGFHVLERMGAAALGCVHRAWCRCPDGLGFAWPAVIGLSASTPPNGHGIACRCLRRTDARHVIACGTNVRPSLVMLGLLSEHDRLDRHTRQRIGWACHRGCGDRAVAWCALFGLGASRHALSVASRINATTTTDTPAPHTVSATASSRGRDKSHAKAYFASRQPEA